MLKHTLSAVLISASLYVFNSIVYAAPILLTDADGQLTGAEGVNVNGIAYDVEFVEGACITLFNGCDNLVEDFAFTTQTDADAASWALLDQVFNNTSAGNFATDTSRTPGCVDPEFCAVVTPYSLSLSLDAVFLSAAARRISTLPTGTQVRETVFGIIRDPASPRGFASVKWAPVSAVPVPAAVWLFGTALLGLVGFSKRRKAA